MTSDKYSHNKGVTLDVGAKKIPLSKATLGTSQFNTHLSNTAKRELCNSAKTMYTVLGTNVYISKDTSREVDTTYRATVGDCVSFLFRNNEQWYTDYDENMTYREKVASAVMFMLVRNQHESSE